MYLRTFKSIFNKPIANIAILATYHRDLIPDKKQCEGGRLYWFKV